MPDATRSGKLDRSDQPLIRIGERLDVVDIEKLFRRQFALCTRLDVYGREREFI